MLWYTLTVTKTVTSVPRKRTERTQSSANIEPDSPLLRLLDFLAWQRSGCGRLDPRLESDLLGMARGIDEILDLYIRHKASREVQHRFNSLAAKFENYGRVPLRLNLGARDFSSLKQAMGDSFEVLRKSANPKLGRGSKALTSAQLAQKARANAIASAVDAALQADSLTSAFSYLKLRRAAKVSLQPTLVAAVTANPMFDLWLVLLDPELAGRVRRCPTSQCGQFFAAWTGKKTFCSDLCRNRFWNRSRRAASPSSRTR